MQQGLWPYFFLVFFIVVSFFSVWLRAWPQQRHFFHPANRSRIGSNQRLGRGQHRLFQFGDQFCPIKLGFVQMYRLLRTLSRL